MVIPSGGRGPFWELYCIDTSGTALLIVNNQPVILTYENYMRVSIFCCVNGVRSLFRVKNENKHYALQLGMLRAVDVVN